MRRSTPIPFPYGAGYPPTWRGAPHHMVPGEARLLHAWYDSHNTGVDEVWYDVAMDGTPSSTPADTADDPPHPASFQRMWQRLNSKRADAIARIGERYRIIELRSAAQPQTIGELHQYRYLAAAEWPQLSWLRPLLITSYIDAMIRLTIEASDIDVVVLDLPIITT